MYPFFLDERDEYMKNENGHQALHHPEQNHQSEEGHPQSNRIQKPKKLT